MATDPDGDDVTYAIVDSGLHGTAVITDPDTGAFTYTPDTDVAGVDTLTFTASDGDLDSNEATVKVTITGLVGHWEMENDLTDSAPPANDANGAVTPIYDTGRIGDALVLDGSNQYATVPNSADLDITGPITMAAWVKPDVVGTQHLIKKATMNLVNGYELSLSSPGHVFTRFNQVASADTYRIDATSFYPTDGDTWIHVAATWDGTTITLYVNGAAEGTVDFAGPIATNDLALGIGAQADGTSKLNGSLDDVRLYNRALGDTEIAALYAPAGVPRPSPSTRRPRASSSAARPRSAPRRAPGWPSRTAPPRAASATSTHRAAHSPCSLRAPARSPLTRPATTTGTRPPRSPRTSSSLPPTPSVAPSARVAPACRAPPSTCSTRPPTPGSATP